VLLGNRKDASRWAIKNQPLNPKADEPSVVSVGLKVADGNVSSVVVATDARCKAVLVETEIACATAVVSPSRIGVEESTHDQAEQSPSSVKLPSEALQNPSQIDLAECRVKRGVRIDDASPIVYEITPYAAIYGLHPREFVFDGRYFMVPADGFNEMAAACETEWADEEDSDSDVEDMMCKSEWYSQYTI